MNEKTLTGADIKVEVTRLNNPRVEEYLIKSADARAVRYFSTLSRAIYMIRACTPLIGARREIRAASLRALLSSITISSRLHLLQQTHHTHRPLTPLSPQATSLKTRSAPPSVGTASSSCRSRPRRCPSPISCTWGGHSATGAV